MPSGWPYALGTLLCWIGLVEGLLAVYRLVQVIVPPRGVDPLDARKRTLAAALTAGVCLLASGPLLRGHEGGQVFIPVAWFVMPFPAWLAVATGLVAILRVCKLPFAGRPEQAVLVK